MVTSYRVRYYNWERSQILTNQKGENIALSLEIDCNL